MLLKARLKNIRIQIFQTEPSSRRVSMRKHNICKRSYQDIAVDFDSADSVSFSYPHLQFVIDPQAASKLS